MRQLKTQAYQLNPTIDLHLSTYILTNLKKRHKTRKLYQLLTNKRKLLKREMCDKKV